jgi:Extensin-like protein C-terminus
MRRALAFSIGGGVVLLALAGCGRGLFMGEERAPWRHEAEVACMKSGAVKIGVTQIDPIEGPGACGMDFPLKVTALGEYSPALSYADQLLPPASIPNASSTDMPNWPPSQDRYRSRYQSRYSQPPQTAPVESEPAPPAQAAPGARMRWVTGPPGIDISKQAPARQPLSISPQESQPATPYLPPASSQQPTYRQPAYGSPRARALPSDIPADAIIPRGGSAAVPQAAGQRAYNAPNYEPPQQRTLPPLGPMRGPQNATLIPAELAPPAKLACPIVSALDRWVSEGVQPAAIHWFGQPVTEIHQIGSYACRDMIGAGTDHISEHAFGNALDISGFTLANGRTITVKDGWHGTPEEQGFLHDVQLYACETFTTVLAPGYNPEHYNHIHVDLMRRRPGYRPCRPEAIPGEVVAARVRARYAARHRGPAYTGSINGQSGAITAVAGEDGFVADNGAQTSPPIKTPPYLGHRIKLPNEDRFAIH